VGVGLSHDLDVVSGREHLGETLAKEVVVVAKDDPDEALMIIGAHRKSLFSDNSYMVGVSYVRVMVSHIKVPWCSPFV